MTNDRNQRTVPHRTEKRYIKPGFAVCKFEENTMLGFFLTTIVTALSLLVVDLVVPGVDLATFPAAVIAAIAIGLVNSFVIL
jgi:hypothetical protein